MPALIIAGRWLKGFGTAALTADDAAKGQDTINDLRAQVSGLTEKLDEAKAERDEAQRIADAAVKAKETPKPKEAPKPSPKTTKP